jgi:Phage head-tail joining protein
MKRRAYDRVIQFQRSTPIDDGLALREGEFVAYGDAVPASFVPGVGSERFANAQNAATAPGIFRFWYTPDLADLTPADRINDGGIIYGITSVRWDGRTTSEVEVAATMKFGA